MPWHHHIKHVSRIWRNVALLSLFIALMSTGFLMARLFAAPIPIPWAVPLIEDALQESGGITQVLGVSDLSLMWDSSAQRIVFAAENVRLADQAQTLTAVERVDVTLNAAALLTGHLRVKDVTLVGPRLHLTLGGNGADKAGAAPLALLSADKNAALANLHSVKIEHGMIELMRPDSQARDILSNVEFNWHRRSKDASDADFSGTLRLAEDPTPRLLHAELHESASGMDLRAGAQEIWPDSVQNILNRVAPTLVPAALSLERLQMPITLDAKLHLDPQGVMTHVSAAVTAGMGHVIIPEAFQTALPVENLQITGDYDVPTGGWHITQARGVIFDEDGRIPLQFSGHGEGAKTIAFDASMPEISVPALKRWWPEGVVAGGYAWIDQNVSAGKVLQTKLSLSLAQNAHQGYDITAAQGSWQVQGVVTSFMKNFPEITGINATATMDSDSIHFDVQSGQLKSLMLQPGTIDMTGLRADNQIMKIDVPVTGQLPVILQLLDTPPYGYAKKYGLNAVTVSGGVGLRTQFEFPLLAALQISDVKYHALANLHQVALPGALMSRDVTHGEGTLELDPDTLKINGNADLSGVPIDFAWQDFQAPQNGLTRQVNFNASLSDEDHGRLGLPTAGFVHGPAKLSGTYEVRGGQGTVRAKMDLAAANVTIKDLNYAKPASAPLVVNSSIGMGGGANSFSLTAAGQNLALDGSGVLDADMKPQKLDFGVFRIGDKTNAQVKFEQQPGREHWMITGQSLDVSGLLDESDTGEAKSEEKKPARWIGLQLSSLGMAHQIEMKDVQAELNHDGSHWNKVLMQGKLPGGAALNIDWDAGKNGAQRLSVTAEDAGAALSAFGVTDSLRGGHLTIDGQGDLSAPQWLSNGKVAITDFKIVNTPLLAKLLTLTSPGGLLDTLRGEGVGFSTLECGFEYSDQLLRLRGGKAHGSALGLTFEGDIDHAASPATLKMSGTIVPLYAVNTALSNVPIVGDLLLGKDGGGLLGFNYSASGAVADPAVSVNPLSVLTPGFLRDLLFNNSSVPDKP